MDSCSRTGNTLGVLLLGLLLGSPAALPAAGARLVVDANQGPANELTGYPPPVELWSFRGRALFLVDARPEDYGSLPRRSPGPQVQLWASDGTPAGTQLLAWFCLASVDPCLFGRARFWGESGGGVLFEVGSVLWRTDGTPQGTFRLHSQLCSSESYPPGPTEILFSGRFYFAASQPVSGCELWQTDGRIDGTVQAADLVPGPYGSAPRGFVALRGRFYFGASLDTDDYDTYAVWASDGTEQGTSPVFQARFVTLLTVGGGKLFFQAWQTARPDATALWVSDGTSAGTRALRRFPVTCSYHCAPVIWFLVPAAFGVVFVANDGEHNDQAWASDGTRAGTRRLTALEGPYPTAPNEFGWQGSTVPEAFVSAGSTTLFAVNGRGGDGATSQLWSTRGTPASTDRLVGCPGGCPRVRYAFHRLPGGKRVLMSGSGRKRLGFELWSSDGTARGTQLLRDLCPGPCSSFPSTFVTVGSAVYFSALDEKGLALWKTDGTAAGTLRLGRAQLPDRRAGMTAAGGQVFFGAANAAGTEGLWATDGTPEGTRIIAALGAPVASSNPRIARFGQRALFTAFDGHDQALWSSDGSPEGTLELATAPELFDNQTPDELRVPVIAGGRAFSLVGYRDAESVLFRARLIRTGATPEGTKVIHDFGETFVSHPFEFRGRLTLLRCGKHHLPLSSRRFCAFWASDGTGQGTVKLFDFPYPVDFLYQPVAFGASFFFSYSYGAATYFVRSDGMRAFPLAELHGSDPFSGFGGEIVAVGGKVFFTFSGRLWRSDGTSEGTAPLLAEAPEIVVDGGLAELGGRLLFFGTIKEEPPRTGLWSTDGTRQGTILLRAPLEYGRLLAFDDAVTFRIGNRLLFRAADSEHGFELWATDGTPEGTALVRDVVPGSGSSSPASLVEVGEAVYFAATDYEHGRELWRSDGTEPGTRLVQDLAPGPLSSSPEELTLVGEQLFFAADDFISSRGYELWALPLSDALVAAPHR